MSPIFSRKRTFFIGLRRYSNFLRPVPALPCQNLPTAAKVLLDSRDAVPIGVDLNLPPELIMPRPPAVVGSKLPSGTHFKSHEN